jgi:hypothetical protein
LKAHFAIISHCIYKWPTIHHWMHSLPDPLPPMSDNMVATIMNDAGGKWQAVAAIIFKSDLPSAHPQLLNYTVELVKAVEAIKAMVSRPDHSIIIVALKLRDPLAGLSEEDCKTVYVRQYTLHTVSGSA